ncbi:Flagellar associated protein, related [Eimeria maxima]|uniref:Flagellar associated protein, related n=1 Tax=Eimeria maxima TaxID=5804 RepID=U6M441_EIMMA|nr:Flagellar associated protein, related [Eimeria maxima]CDJ57194.1 Flagellar associated protein, related [Eimeria maxima]
MHIARIAAAPGFLSLYFNKTSLLLCRTSSSRGIFSSPSLPMASQDGDSDPGSTVSVGLEPFCFRQFDDPKYPGTRIPLDKDSFMKKVSSRQDRYTGYLARRPEELPVLSRWLPASLVQHQLVRAKYLDLILYSREQIAKENAAMSKNEEVIDTSQPEWFIVAIKAQNEPFELPMNPITIMRNALIEEGGSGVSVNREAYGRSVEYWSKHVVVQDDNE